MDTSWIKGKKGNYKHGMRHTRIYNIWRSMRQRCNNPGCGSYEKYGAKGVKVCDEWESFPAFYDWAMENGYSDTLSIDRIDPFGNYEPLNCRWADLATQENNKRTTVRLTINGETKTIHEWSEVTGVPHKLIWERMKYGIPEDRILYLGNLHKDRLNNYKRRKETK